jgi:ABC-type branched-subunit amino acid transport system ATPase component
VEEREIMTAPILTGPILTGPILSIRNLRKNYSGVIALDDVSCDIEAGGIIGLIGPNGSGKSTLFDCVTGISRADHGAVEFAGSPIAGLAAHVIARRGLARTFQNLRIFPQLTAEQNLLAAAQAQSGLSFLREVAGGASVRSNEEQAAARAETLLREIDLLPNRDQPAGQLSYGQQKLIVLSMALMAEPKLVMFDEPVAGVNPALVERIKLHIRQWNERGIGFFIIEHNLRLVMDLCDSVIVLDRGKLLLRDTPAVVAEDERVIEAYLGRRRRT